MYVNIYILIFVILQIYINNLLYTHIYTHIHTQNLYKMYRTPTKHQPSTPKTKQSFSTSPSQKNISSPSYYSILKMINSQHLIKINRKSSLMLHKSMSNITNKEQCLIQDRFIPSRKLINQFQMNQEEMDIQINKNDPQSLTVADIYSQEILGKNMLKQQNNNQNDIWSFKNTNLLKFRLQYSTPRSMHYIPNSFTQITANYNKNRRINKNPVKVLDAPALSDDFYLNLIDWSNHNQLAVGLSNSIYLWNADNSKVTRLCQLNNDSITSVCWSVDGQRLAVGCNKGQVLIWDVNEQKQLRRMDGHEIRVGSMAWSKKILSTGSRDKTILQRDQRCCKNSVQKLSEHGQQICGLKWSKDDQFLASGGNDNKVIVWNLNGQSINKFCDHKAAVKALAWSPHQHGLLATGGGTADRMIKMRNVFTGEIICSEDTGSQICNLQFSKTTHQVVSTHGYSQNQVNIWSYPNMKKVATLKGHTHRVLYLATSPDGSTIVTGAGDETLRFWNIFPSLNSKKSMNESLLQAGITFR